jgi:hypothetical protein
VTTGGIPTPTEEDDMAPRPRPRDDHNAGRFPACLDCGSTGGFWCGGNRTNRAYRKRGLCGLCYDWHRARGTHTDYPLATGHGSHRPPQHPDIPRHYLDPYMLGNTRDQHAVMAGGWDWVAVVNAAELYAASWLAARTLAAA